MKVILYLLLLTPGLCIAQTVKFSIDGKVKNPGTAKYAYLHILKDQLLKAPIKNGHFRLQGTSDLIGNFYRAGLLFIDERDNISFEEVTSKLKGMIWIPGREPFLRSVALEEIQIEIEDPLQMSSSAIVKGILTLQMDEAKTSTRERYPSEFLRKYPDSPVSFHLVKSYLPFYESGGGRGAEVWGPLSDMFGLLSERLRTSEQGLALKEKIDQL